MHRAPPSTVSEPEKKAGKVEIVVGRECTERVNKERGRNIEVGFMGFRVEVGKGRWVIENDVRG